MQNIATSNLSIININNKTSTIPLVRFSGFMSTKSRFLCFIGIRNPRFQAIRAQNRDICALLRFETPIFGLPEHKIGVFVRFWVLEPPFSGISSTKSRFLCFFGLRNPRFQAFRAQNRGLCALFAFRTPIFELPEHKIAIFVLEQTGNWYWEA